MRLLPMQMQGLTIRLRKSFEESLERQRALWEEVSRITSNESIRFAKQRLDKTTKAVQTHVQSDKKDP